jgi:hypothetical protein
LRGEPRLNDRLAAVAVAYVADVVLDSRQELLRFEVGDNFFTRSIAVQAGVGTTFGIDVAGIVHHVDGGEIVALAECEVVGIVCRGYLDRAGAEFAADPLVEDDGDLAVHQWQAELLAVEMEVALVFRMNGYGYVAEHGLGAGGCYG